jgi:hypothetical protein
MNPWEKYGSSDQQAPWEKYGAAPPSAPAGEPSALSRAAGSFWDKIGGKQLEALAGAAKNGDAGKAVDTLKGILNGVASEGPRIMDQLNQAGDAASHGSLRGFLHHVITAVPVVGPMSDAGAHEISEGKIPEAVGTAAALAFPGVAKEVAPSREALASAGTAARGAAKGAYQAATETVPLTKLGVEVSLPKPLVTGAAAATAARVVGLPHELGAVVGAAAPIVKGAVEGAKAALAERVQRAVESLKTPEAEAPPATGPGVPPSPEPTPTPTPQAAAPAPAVVEPPAALLEDIAQGQTGKPFRRLNATQQAQIKDIALRVSNPKLAGPQLVPQSAPKVVSQEVSGTLAGNQAPAAPSAVQDLAQQLRDEMAKSGTLPPAPETVDPKALADNFREIPDAMRRPMADANYRAVKEGNAHPDTAGPVYEAAGRADKSSAVSRALFEQGIPADHAESQLTRTTWKMLFQQIGERDPSPETIAETLFQLRKLEKAAELSKPLVQEITRKK